MPMFTQALSAGPRRLQCTALRPSRLTLMLAVALALPLSAHAAEAMRVVRDPATGELRGPTAAEAAAFAKAEAQLRAQSSKAPAKGPVEVRYADGTVETKLGDDTHMVSVVSETGDGSLALDCLPADQVKAFHDAAGKAPNAKAGMTKAAAPKVGKASHDHK